MHPQRIGVVLAGGASRRFGTDKLAAALDGQPLVMHALEALATVPDIDRVVVVAPALPTNPSWLKLVAQTGADIVRDEEPFGGPLAGLATALRELPPDATALVVGGDMPWLDRALLAGLASAVTADRLLASVETLNNLQPLPLAVSVGAGRRTATQLLGRGERRLRAFVESFENRARISAPEPVRLLDVDTPGDLARASGERTSATAFARIGGPTVREDA